MGDCVRFIGTIIVEVDLHPVVDEKVFFFITLGDPMADGMLSQC